MQHKRRWCAWPALPGLALCGNHAAKDECVPAATYRQSRALNVACSRVPCPLDSRHSVLAAELTAHLRVCNAAREAAAATAAVHLQPGCNGGGESTSDDDDGEAAEAEALALWQCRDEGDALEAARQAVRAVADALLAAAAATAPLPEPASEPQCVSAAFAALRAAAGAAHATTPFDARHATQQAGIVSHMHAAGLLPPPSDGAVYVELGAGRGYLTHFLAEAYAEAHASYLLVERRAYRHKAERSLRREAFVSRLKCDVTDLDLATAPLPPPAVMPLGPRRLVAIAKHLCGSGTDAALRCASRATAADGSRVLFGIAVAPCCHHACKWRIFCGKQALRRRGIGPLQFALASRMASWAVCAGGASNDDADAEHPSLPPATDARWGLSAAERRAVGVAAKQLFDAARAEWATSRCGGKALLVSYCAPQVSPEHRLLVLRSDE